MGARPKLTQKRRTQMLEAAMEVIAERGLCETRIADVADRAGLSPALVVYYFGSKETLLTEALAYAEDLFYIEAFRELTGIEGASKRLVRLIDLACPPVVRRESDEYWTLWVELWSRALRNDEAARKREALERRWRNTIAEVVREGQRSGEFGPCDPERFATYLSALMDGLAPNHRRTRQLYQPHHALRCTLDARQLPESLYVEKVLRVSERLGQKLLLGPEVVHHQRRTQARPVRHVGYARVTQTPLSNHLHGRLQHLRAALLRQLGPRSHHPPTLYIRTCERLFNLQR